MSDLAAPRAEALRPAAFLDRDGTLNVELEQPIRRALDLVWIPGALEGAAALHRAGFALVVITNQAAIARGTLDPSELERVHAELRRRFDAAGAPLAAIEVCPHHPSEGAPPYRRECDCRKPGCELIRRASRRLALDLARSWTIGDARRDVQAGLDAGTRAVLVTTGKGERERAVVEAEYSGRVAVAPDLRSAAELALRSQGR